MDSPSMDAIPFRGPALLRFRAQFLIGAADQCWDWRGRMTKGGYGLFWTGVHTTTAHRAAYMIATGTEPPAHLHVHHECVNRRCVNPNHLRLVSRSENNRLAQLPFRAHARCPFGHPYEWLPALRLDMGACGACTAADTAREHAREQSRAMTAHERTMAALRAEVKDLRIALARHEPFLHQRDVCKPNLTQWWSGQQA